jgi:hypothetical protein
LHPYLRLAFGTAANIFLAARVVPQIAHVRDDYSAVNALRASLEVVVPCAALLAMLPVVFLGRDVPRLLAIGLSFLPGYVAIFGFGDALSIWLSGR